MVFGEGAASCPTTVNDLASDSDLIPAVKRYIGSHRGILWMSRELLDPLGLCTADIQGARIEEVLPTIPERCLEYSDAFTARGETVVSLEHLSMRPTLPPCWLEIMRIPQPENTMLVLVRNAEARIAAAQRCHLASLAAGDGPALPKSPLEESLRPLLLRGVTDLAELCSATSAVPLQVLQALHDLLARSRVTPP